MFTFSIITASYKRIENLKFLHKLIIENKNYLFNIEWVVIVEEEYVETINFLRNTSQKDIKIKTIVTICVVDINVTIMVTRILS